MPSHQRSGSSFTSGAALSSTTPNSTIRGQWSTSDKYVRFELLEKEKFERVMRQQAMNESRSPFLPSNWQEYLSHRADLLDDRIAAEKAAIAAKEEQSRARRRNPGSAEVLPAFGGRDLRGVASCSVEDYWRWKRMWWPGGEEVASANRGMDGDRSFRSRGEYLLGEDLVKSL